MIESLNSVLTFLRNDPGLMLGLLVLIPLVIIFFFGKEPSGPGSAV